MIELFLSVVFGLLIVIAVIVGAAYFWQYYYFVPSNQDETSFFVAEDGRRLAAHRYRPAGEPAGYPVILCHGLNANRYMFDLPGLASLAPYLREKGRDVWSAELRGSGMSASPGLLWSDVPYRWGFDDLLTKDVPAIIGHVLERTGAERVHWVGHSMGGMLIMAHLAATRDPRIASATTVGSPADFSKVSGEAFRVLMSLKWTLKLTPICPITFIGRFATPFAHRFGSLFMEAFHPPNINPDQAGRALALGAELITPSRLWLDFGRFLEQGVFARPDGENYLKGLPECSTPLLAVAGSKDAMVSPAAVRAVCEAADDTSNRECVVVGKEQGCEEDYGHIDLVLGRRAHLEVFPLIEDHLSRRDG